jgi:hypothetical protein
MVLRFVAGKEEPTEYQLWAADMNEDGEIKADDAILILLAVAGMAAPASLPANAANEITLMLAEAHAVSGESLTVPLKVDNIASLAGGSVSISYDSSTLRPTEVVSASGTLASSNISQPGVLRIAFASNRLSNRTVAEIQFEVLSDRTSPLKFSNVKLYRQDALPVDARVIDGRFSSWAIAPKRSAVLQNFPNPFNPETWIPYQLAEETDVAIRIYNVNGQLIRTLSFGRKPAGSYLSKGRAAYWDGRNDLGEEAASGIYYYSISAGHYAATRKMIVRK